MPTEVAPGENSARYSTRADTGQNPMHTEGYASSMWSLATMDLEIVPTHSGIDTPKHIDPKFLLAYSIVLRMGQNERERKKNRKIGKVKKCPKIQMSQTARRTAANLWRERKHGK